MDEDKKTESMDMTVSGFDAEFNGFPSVAVNLALINKANMPDQEVLDLCNKARTYLRLILDRAIARQEAGSDKDKDKEKA